MTGCFCHVLNLQPSNNLTKIKLVFDNIMLKVHNLFPEQKPLPPLKYMTEPVKLLDDNLEFNNAALEFLHDSSTNYLVVGIIGKSNYYYLFIDTQLSLMCLRHIVLKFS